MYCPFCNFQETRVVDSRLSQDGTSVRRRRECLKCVERFTTYETVEFTMPYVVKRDDSRVDFNEDKLRKGLLKALEKRPVGMDQVDQSILQICKKIRSTGEREVKTQFLGELVMEELKKLDQVAYVRFASVYRSFQDLDEFRSEIEKLITN